jgi:hypothetical protein
MLRITPLFKAFDRPAKVFGALEVNVVAVSETTHEVSPSVGWPSTTAGWIEIILPSRWCQKRSWDRHDQRAMENRASRGDVESAFREGGRGHQVQLGRTAVTRADGVAVKVGSVKEPTPFGVG